MVSCPVCFPAVVFYSALGGSCHACSALVGSSPVRSALVGSRSIRSALVGSRSVRSALVGSRSVCSALVGSRSVCSALVGSSSSRLRSTALLDYLGASGSRSLGGGGYVTNPGHELLFINHQRSLTHHIDFHTTQTVTDHSKTAFPIIHCTNTAVRTDHAHT